ncbi:MAG TPA: hypothetical protein VJG49_04475 [Candidatus Nanoarchaeia archaeon]|nr:hypothetical protein [Candidatus Nanoarchaeia archaeon]
MNLKPCLLNFNLRVLTSLALLVFVFIVGCTPAPDCTTINYVDTVIEVEPGNKTYVGLNADRDLLNFGKVSPGAVVKRSIAARYSKPALVKVAAEGDFSSWININPVVFSLPSPETGQETKETQETVVYFTVTVPEQAPVQKYSGQIKFCFQE